MLTGADRADVGYKCWYREPVKITSESPTGGKKEALACRRLSRSALSHSSSRLRGFAFPNASVCSGADVDYDSQQVFVRRSWTGGKVGKSKSAASKAPVPLVPLLAGFIRQWQEQTPYGQPTDWVFASTRLKGKRPRVANMLVEDHLRPAAVKVGALKKGEKVRFGFHNLRHSLASFLVRKGTDVKTVQKMLRHSDVATTLGIYAHSMSEDRLAAQDDMLAAMMPPSNAVN
jgi:hypothetical protein